MHYRRRTEADVTEGSGGIWERLTDSNVCAEASDNTYAFTRQPNFTTDIDVVVVRDDKNLKGRVLGFVLGTICRHQSSWMLKKSSLRLDALVAWPGLLGQ